MDADLAERAAKLEAELRDLRSKTQPITQTETMPVQSKRSAVAPPLSLKHPSKQYPNRKAMSMVFNSTAGSSVAVNSYAPPAKKRSAAAPSTNKSLTFSTPASAVFNQKPVAGRSVVNYSDIVPSPLKKASSSPSSTLARSKAASKLVSATFSNNPPAAFKKLRNTHNRPLVASSYVRPPSAHIPTLRKSPRKQPSAAAAVASARRIVIDGVAFEFDATGTRLNKVVSDATSSHSAAATSSYSASASQDSTPKRAQIGNAKFVRTKTGNLISAELAALRAKKKRLGNMVLVLNGVQRARNGAAAAASKRKRDTTRAAPKPKKMCLFYTRTGRCKNGLSCPYIHDEEKLAICNASLHSKCLHDAKTCPLSHTPTPHNTPHCSHFNSSTGCRVTDCPYPHIHLGDVAVCREFAILGYCEQGADCDKRHVRECPGFADTGKCDDKKCRLPHIEKGAALDLPSDDDEDSDSDGSQEVSEGDTAIEASVANGTDQVLAARKKRRLSSTDRVKLQDDFINFNSGPPSSDNDAQEENIDLDNKLVVVVDREADGEDVSDISSDSEGIDEDVDDMVSDDEFYEPYSDLPEGTSEAAEDNNIPSVLDAQALASAD